MGYEVKDISELDSYDFTESKCTKESVRTSFDRSHFIVEGDNINDYTHEEMLQYLKDNSTSWEEHSNS